VRHHGRGDRGLFWFTIRYIFHLRNIEAYFLRPFYNPQTFTINRVFHGTSVAVLTTLGSTASRLCRKKWTIQAEHLPGYGSGLRDHRILAAAEVYGAQLLSSQYQFRLTKSKTHSAMWRRLRAASAHKAISLTLLIAPWVRAWERNSEQPACFMGWT